MEDTDISFFASNWAERLPWAFVMGVAFYMTAPSEPDMGLLAFLCVCFLIGIVLYFIFRSVFIASFVLALMVFVSGVGWGMVSAHRAQHDVLKYSVWADILGEVNTVSLRNNGYRVVLDHVEVLDEGKTIHLDRARLYLPGRYPPPKPGQIIQIKGALSPPPEPVHAYAFNMPRHAWFEKISAVGFSNSRWMLIRNAKDLSLEQIIASWRQEIRQSIFEVLGRENAVANIVAALLIGERGSIPEQVIENYRGAGLAHMLAISGLHISILAGLAFVLVRRSLLCFPQIALRYPIKKWAAFSALVVTATYLILSGASVPTQRAFLMTAIALGAVMLERTPFSLRLVALAAFVVILFSPEAVTGASFQMSFAAVLALIAVCQNIGQERWFRDFSPVPRCILLYVVGVILTTMIAGLATAPIALYHFGRVATYSIVANVVALPILSLWVMPWALIALVLIPLGMPDFALHRMAEGVERISEIAAHIMTLPHPVWAAPQMPQIGFLLCLAGGFWLVMQARKGRLFGMVLLVVGLSSPWWQSLPDVLIANHGAVVGVRQADGYGMVSLGRDKFIRSVWQSATAETMNKNRGWRCGPLGCVGTLENGVTVARSDHPDGLEDDCLNALLVIARYPVSKQQRDTCGKIVIDQQDLWRFGAMSLWLDPRGNLINQDSVSNHQAKRLWRP